MKEYLNMDYLEEVTEFKQPDEKYYIILYFGSNQIVHYYVTCLIQDH